MKAFKELMSEEEIPRGRRRKRDLEIGDMTSMILLYVFSHCWEI